VRASCGRGASAWCAVDRPPGWLTAS
jgi:hypothetical protein